MFIAMYTSNSHFFTSGGSEVHVRELASALVTLGVHVRVFCNSQYATEEIITTENGVDYIIMPVPRIVNSRNFLGEGFRKFSMFLFNKTMVKALLNSGAQIFHQHDLTSNYFTTLWLAYAKRPVLLTNHLGEYLLLKKHVPDVVLRQFLRPYKHIIGPSRELSPVGLHPSVSTIFNGFNENIYKPDSAARKAKRKELSVKPNEILVVVPRRWAPTKGVLYGVLSVSLHKRKKVNFFRQGRGGDAMPL
jgi:glycosyltransferase involved in cell wall biosynthesis